jgi:hypothetical protein
MKQKGGIFSSIFVQPKALHLQFFASEVSDSNQVCLRICFMPMKKMPKKSTNVAPMICLFGEHFF